MEWLIAHEDELNNQPHNTSDKQPNQAKQSTLEDNSERGEPQSTDGCKAEETAAEEAARRKITVEEAQKLIIERQAKRAEEDRKKAIEDEKKRREMGQKMLETRQELQDQERIRLAQQIRQEKLEKEMHRKKVLEQIARDREAMKNKDKPTADPSATKAPSASSSIPPASRTPASECKLALRFPDGSSKVHNFSPTEQLSAVRLFVQVEKSYTHMASIEFIAPPNKKLTDHQMDETLEKLGLCPASRLEVKYNQSTIVDLD